MILSSTLLLTLLITIGLLFFIKASVKDRTETLVIKRVDREETILPQIQSYFDQRGYRVTEISPESNQVTFQGFVRPSWFMAIFLSTLAGIGFLCLGLVLAILNPTIGYGFLILVILAPLAGLFYWKKAGRMEQVCLSVVSESTNKQTSITITGHRDELAQFELAISRKS